MFHHNRQVTQWQLMQITLFAIDDNCNRRYLAGIINPFYFTGRINEYIIPQQATARLSMHSLRISRDGSFERARRKCEGIN